MRLNKLSNLGEAATKAGDYLSKGIGSPRASRRQAARAEAAGTSRQSSPTLIPRSKIASLPHVDSHRHFGGSCPAHTVVRVRGPESDESQEDAIRRVEKETFYVPPQGKGLPPYLKAYTPVSRMIEIPKPEIANKAAHDMAIEDSANNILATDLRINPFRDLFSFNKVASKDVPAYSEEYARAIAEGLESGRAVAREQGHTPTRYGLIYDGNRFSPMDVGVGFKTGDFGKSQQAALGIVKTMYQQAVRHVMLDGNPCKVAGVGLCGMEDHHSVNLFREAFEDIVHPHNETMAAEGRRDKILGISVHAGEVGTTAQATQEVIDAIKICWKPHTPVRIGHGIRADLDAVRKAVGDDVFQQIHFEMCPISNYQIDDTLSETEPHRAVAASRNGVSVNLNTDNTAMSGSMSMQIEASQATPEDYRKMVIAGLQHSFVLQQEGLNDNFARLADRMFADVGISGTGETPAEFDWSGDPDHRLVDWRHQAALGAH